eukprot:4253192-Pleurochrysis_carterae.AAC.1
MDKHVRRVILGLRCASPCLQERLQPSWVKTPTQEFASSEMKVARRPVTTSSPGVRYTFLLEGDA